MASPTALFWDYENVPLPTSIKAADASKAIVDAVAKHGTRIVDRKLYFDMEGVQPGLWGDLSANGFTPVNTPRRGQKETLDKNLIADMLSFAWDNCSTRNESPMPCVVLISSDGDYTYALNKLKDRKVRTILIHGKDARVADGLKSVVDVNLGFIDDIIRNTTVLGRSENNAVILRNIIQEEVSKENSKAENGWVLANEAAQLFHIKVGSESFRAKQVYQEARELATKKGWLERGRRRLESSRKVEIVATNFKGSGYSLEDFLRVVNLIDMGPERNMVSTAPAVPTGVTTRLFVKNVPRATTVFDLVDQLKTNQGIAVVKACPVRPMYEAQPFIFYFIETGSKEESWRLVRISKDHKVKIGDRELVIEPDRKHRSFKQWDRYRTYTRGDIEKDLAERDCTRAFCKIINLLTGDSWAKAQDVEECFQSLMHEGVKDRCTLVWADAQRKEYIEFGRGSLRSGSLCITHILPPEGVFGKCGDDIHIRLTMKGLSMVRSHMPELSNSSCYGQKRSNDTLNISIKGWPVTLRQNEIVQFLQVKHAVTVKRACIGPVKPGHRYSTAHIEFLTPSDSTKMLELSTSRQLVYEDRSLSACSNEHIPYWQEVPNHLMYEKPPIPAAIYAEETLAPSSLTPEQDHNATTAEHSGNATFHVGNLPVQSYQGNAPPLPDTHTDLLWPNHPHTTTKITDLLWSNPLIRQGQTMSHR